MYCIVKPWIQSNKSISQIKMCMCGEWMMYGDDGDNDGENNGGGSLILLSSLRGTYLPCFLKLYEEKEMLFFFFSLRWVSCTPNSTAGHLSIFTSRLTFFFFFRGSEHLLLFISSYFFYFLLFFRALISWDNIASGSNKITWAFISQGETEIFLVILSRIRSRIFLGDSRDGNGWIYVDGTSGVEVAYMSERASEILI